MQSTRRRITSLATFILPPLICSGSRPILTQLVLRTSRGARGARVCSPGQLLSSLWSCTRYGWITTQESTVILSKPGPSTILPSPPLWNTNGNFLTFFSKVREFMNLLRQSQPNNTLAHIAVGTRLGFSTGWSDSSRSVSTTFWFSSESSCRFIAMNTNRPWMGPLLPSLSFRPCFSGSRLLKWSRKRGDILSEWIADDSLLAQKTVFLSKKLITGIILLRSVYNPVDLLAFMFPLAGSIQHIVWSDPSAQNTLLSFSILFIFLHFVSILISSKKKHLVLLHFDHKHNRTHSPYLLSFF